MDSTHPRHCSVMGYGWIKKGFDKFIPCNSGRAHLNINGAVNIKNLDVVTRQSRTVNKDAICELLRAIKLKNPNEEKIYVIMDNASYNGRKGDGGPGIITLWRGFLLLQARADTLEDVFTSYELDLH